MRQTQIAASLDLEKKSSNTLNNHRPSGACYEVTLLQSSVVDEGDQASLQQSGGLPWVMLTVLMKNAEMRRLPLCLSWQCAAFQHPAVFVCCELAGSKSLHARSILPTSHHN